MRFTAAAIIFLAAGTVCCIISMFCMLKEIDEVNRKLPVDRRISGLGMYTYKRRKIQELYREFYPDGRLEKAATGWEIAGLVSMFLAALTAGIFNH